MPRGRRESTLLSLATPSCGVRPRAVHFLSTERASELLHDVAASPAFRRFLQVLRERDDVDPAQLAVDLEEILERGVEVDEGEGVQLCEGGEGYATAGVLGGGDDVHAPDSAEEVPQAEPFDLDVGIRHRLSATGAPAGARRRAPSASTTPPGSMSYSTEGSVHRLRAARRDDSLSRKRIVGLREARARASVSYVRRGIRGQSRLSAIDGWGTDVIASPRRGAGHASRAPVVSTTDGEYSPEQPAPEEGASARGRHAQLAAHPLQKAHA